MAAGEQLIGIVDEQDWLDRVGDGLQPAVHGAFEAGGEVGQAVKNALHGTWLGHPLHPVLTDVPVGAWTTAMALDVVAAVKGDEGVARGADAAIAFGLVGAVGAAVTGLTDWSDTHGRAKRIGVMHAALNSGATVLYTASWLLRKRNARKAGVALSTLGFAIAGASAWLGGHIVYGEAVGVDHTIVEPKVEEWTAVLDESELPEGKLVRAVSGESKVLLVRRRGQIHAIAETCSHLGGPLAEGKLEGDTVQCPWHGSRFDVTDGSLVDGPSTYDQPCYDVRVRDGKIEVKAATRYEA